MSASMMRRATSTVSTGSVVPGTIGTPASRISSRARVFEPIASIALAGGPMKTIPASSRARERGVLGEEPVARVDRLGARLARDPEDLLDGEVALGGGGSPEQVGLAR